MTSDTQQVGPSKMRWVGLGLGLAVVAVIWLTTLQTSPGAPSETFTDPAEVVMDDSGNFVIAWQRWGVVHAPGYPFLGLVANLITPVLRLFVTPITAASLVSWLLGLGAMAMVGLLVVRHDRTGVATVAAVGIAALGEMTWLYGSVAETYAMGLLLGFASVVLAVALGEQPSVKRAVALGLLFGLAVGHHRTLLALSPALALAAWPALRALPWTTWLWAGLAGASTVVVYAYLPLVAALGSPWVYGRSPATWEGFLDAVLAREYEAQLLPEYAPALALVALWERVWYVAKEIGWAVVVSGAVGIGVAAYFKETRRLAAVLAVILMCYVFAPVGQFLLIGTHMLVMVAAVVCAVGVGLGLAALGLAQVGGRWPRAAALGAVVVALVLGRVTYTRNRAYVVRHSQDPLGAQMLDTAEALADGNAGVTLVEVWGPRYFNLMYDKLLTGELAQANVVDVGVDLDRLAPGQLPTTVHGTYSVLYLAGVDDWERYYGQPVALRAAGDQMVTISTTPMIEALPAVIDAPVIVQSAEAWWEDGEVRLEVEWQATDDLTVDYRVFMHLTDVEVIAGPDDILAQGDRSAPVWGFYPTSEWEVGEVVLDSYRVAVDMDAARVPDRVVVGLFTVTDEGTFENVVSEVVMIGGEE